MSFAEIDGKGAAEGLPRMLLLLQVPLPLGIVLLLLVLMLLLLTAVVAAVGGVDWVDRGVGGVLLLPAATVTAVVKEVGGVGLGAPLPLVLLPLLLNRCLTAAATTARKGGVEGGGGRVLGDDLMKLVGDFILPS